MEAAVPLLEKDASSEDIAELRRCIRDLVALSSLPAIWIKADARQIADSVAQLALSVLDVDYVYVRLDAPPLEILHARRPDRLAALDAAVVGSWVKRNAKIQVVHPTVGTLRSTCVPVGRGANSVMAAFSRRADFPLDTEQV